MPKAGWCAACGANVWLTEDGACGNGHDASQVTGVYEAERPAEDDPLRKAADAMEDAAHQVGTAAAGAWEQAKPAASEAAHEAAEAARKAAEAAGAFGRKFFGKADSPSQEGDSQSRGHDGLG